MTLTPLISFHIVCALTASATGAMALWVRLKPHHTATPTALNRLHRLAGYVFVLAMVATALSALGIRSHTMLNWHGFTWLHVLIPVTLLTLTRSFWQLARGNIRAHRRSMQGLYVAGCIGAGFFALAPGRYFGDLLWHSLPHALSFS